MNYSAEYSNKLIDGETAAKLIKNGDWVEYGWCTNTINTIDRAIAKRVPELNDVKFRGGVLLKEPEIFKVPNAADHFTWNSWHMSGVERKAIEKGFAYYSPMRYSELPGFYRAGIAKVDVALFQTTPMDEHGYFNFGPNASHLMAICENAKLIIVEINENMPRCLGGKESEIHISQINYIVEGENEPISELGSGGAPTDVDKAVAKLIVEEIPNGACLQLGIGGMPNAVGSMIAQSDLKDLGVHTEMYVDAFVEISNAGKISGSKKSLDRYRQAYAFGAGTKKLYDYLDNNPQCMSVPVDYTNDTRVIAQIDNFISVNNAIEIDLFGQVNSESVGVNQISGAGGQLDFVLGAYLSNGGKSFICCSSTFGKADSTKSRIVSTMNPGSIITDTRANIHYFVTEYGKVCLKGISTWEKSEKIISVAHPDFRDSLIKDAEEMKIWRKSNKR